MRVLVVAAYLSIDGGYGGPVSVAVDHAVALTGAGHEVTLVLGWDGLARPPCGVRTLLFRARRPSSKTFAGMVAPGLCAWVLRHAADFDVVHAHVTRDLVTLPAAAIAALRRRPVVLQTHGQIRPIRSRGQALLDGLLTRWVFRRARAFLVLTDHELGDLAALGVDRARMHTVDNGVPLSARTAVRQEEGPLVLFSSRLAPRKRPQVFVQAAQIVHRSRPDVCFELWGPDGGERAAVESAISAAGLEGTCIVCGATDLDGARANLVRAAVFVLPSRAEPFPMALLEAWSAAVPSVITEDTGLSRIALDAGAALLTDGSPERIAAAVLTLLDDPVSWAATSTAARALVEGRFTLDRIADRLTTVYEEVRA